VVAVVFCPPDKGEYRRISSMTQRVRPHFLKVRSSYFFGFCNRAQNARDMIEDSKKLRILAVYVTVTPDVVMSDLLKTTRGIGDFFRLLGCRTLKSRNPGKKIRMDSHLRSQAQRSRYLRTRKTLETESVDGENVPCWMP